VGACGLPLGLTATIPIIGKLGTSTAASGSSCLASSAKIDYLGAATITASVVSLLLALSWVGHTDAWDARRVVARILLDAFVPLQLRAAEPVIPPSLFNSRVLISASLLMFCAGIGMFGIILYYDPFLSSMLYCAEPDS